MPTDQQLPDHFGELNIDTEQVEREIGEREKNKLTGIFLKPGLSLQKSTPRKRRGSPTHQSQSPALRQRITTTEQVSRDRAMSCTTVADDKKKKNSSQRKRTKSMGPVGNERITRHFRPLLKGVRRMGQEEENS